MEFVHLIILFFSGLLCGIINIIAGGGSMVTLPLLIAFGVPADVANGTNRIGILMQDIGATIKFQRQKVIPLKEASYLSIPTLAGSIIGAFFAVSLSKNLMNWIIICVIFAVAMVILFGGNSLLMNKAEKPFKMTFLTAIIFFVIGFYGGFIQVGMTYLTMAACMLLLGNGLIRANIIKIFLNMIIIPIALFIFFYHGLINWTFGITLGIGSLIGGILGAKFATKWSPRTIKIIILSILSISMIYMLWHTIFNQ